MADTITDDNETPSRQQRSFGQRLIWFVLLWGAGVLSLFIVGTIIRSIMF